MPKLGALGGGGGQIFQTRPNSIDLGALVCDSYPSIDIPKIVKIDQTQAQVCMYYQPQDHKHCKMAFWSITQEQACQCSKILMPFLSLSDSIIVIFIFMLQDTKYWLFWESIQNMLNSVLGCCSP